MAWPLRRWFRLGWWIICSLTLLALPLIVWDFFKEGMPIKYQAWFVGGIFCLISIPISIYEVAMHIEYYTRPRLQRHVIRILWMVPIYAIDAWFALRFRSAREYLDPVRECYEAYVIWNFYAYLMAFLEDEQGDVELYLSRKPQMNHFPPFKYCIAPWTMGRKFLMETKKGVMNYVILRPLMTAIGLITDWFGKYGQGHIDFTKSYVYLVAVTNFSQLWALYCLAMMYSACHQELAPIRPLSKFLCIKAVVFLTFWQGVVLAVLVSSGWITDQSWSTYDQLGVASGIQDFLVCVEMFIAALAHAYAFPPKDYMGAGHTKGFVHNVKHMFDLRDVVQDMGDVVEDHVGTAAEAVTTTTQAVLTVPKQAVRTAAKGLKLFTSAEHGKKGDKGWSPRSSSEDGDEDERLEEGRMQHPTDLELEAAARLPLLPASSPGHSSVGRAIQPRPSATLRKPLLRDLTSSSTPTDSPTLHHRHVSDPAALGELGTRPTHVRRTSSRTSDIEEQMAIKLPEKQIERAGSKAGGMASWWGSSSTQKSGSGELNAVRGASAARTRPVRDEAQQPLLGSQPESPLVNDNPLKHHD